MSKLKKILFAALFLATTVVFNRFLSIKTPIIMISFTFVPVMLCAILLGPWWTMAVAGLADLIGALLFPFGAYFVGYTISSALAGLIYGFFLKYKPNKSQKRMILDLILSILIVIVVCNAFLNSLWIYMTTKKALAVILPTRLLKQLIMFPVEVVTIYSINLGLSKMGVYKKLFPVDEVLDEELNETKSENADATLDATKDGDNKIEDATKVENGDINKDSSEETKVDNKTEVLDNKNEIESESVTTENQNSAENENGSNAQK